MSVLFEVADKVPFKKSSRKWNIINKVMELLKVNPHASITTAKLSQKLNLSEMALYKHFHNKDSIFLTLLDIVETFIFHKINFILNNEKETLIKKLKQVISLWINLSTEHKDLAVILSGQAFIHMGDYIITKHGLFCGRFEDELKKLLKAIQSSKEYILKIPRNHATNLVMTTVEGRVWRFVRSGFLLSPSLYWDESLKEILHQIIIKKLSHHIDCDKKQQREKNLQGWVHQL